MSWSLNFLRHVIARTLTKFIPQIPINQKIESIVRCSLIIHTLKFPPLPYFPTSYPCSRRCSMLLHLSPTCLCWGVSFLGPSRCRGIFHVSLFLSSCFLSLSMPFMHACFIVCSSIYFLFTNYSLHSKLYDKKICPKQMSFRKINVALNIFWKIQ